MWIVVAALVGVIAVLGVVVVARGGSKPATPTASTPQTAATSPAGVETPSSENTPQPTDAEVAPRARQTYRDASYGFKFALPGSYQQSSGDGGVEYSSEDGVVSVSVFQGSRSGSAASQYAAARRQFVAEGGRVTYHYTGGDQFVLSGYSGSDDVVYEFRFFGADGVGGFTFRYPRSYPRHLAKNAEAAITQAYNTFNPGGL